MKLLVPTITSTPIPQADLNLFKQNMQEVREALESHNIKHVQYDAIIDSLKFATNIEEQAEAYVNKLATGEVANIKDTLEKIQALAREIRLMQDKAKKSFKKDKLELYAKEYKSAMGGYYPDYLQKFVRECTDYKVMFLKGNEPIVDTIIALYLKSFSGKVESSFEAEHIKNCEHIEKTREMFNKFLENIQEYKAIIAQIPSIGFKNNYETFCNSLLMDCTRPLEQHENTKKTLEQQVELLKVVIKERSAEIEAYKQYDIDYTVDYFNISQPLHLQAILDADLDRLKRLQEPVLAPVPEVKEPELPTKNDVLMVKIKMNSEQTRESIVKTLQSLGLEITEVKLLQE